MVSMSDVIVGFCAASGGATVGLLTGAMLTSGKMKDLESAYAELSGPLHRFLQDHPIEENVEGSLVSPQELVNLRKALDASERMIRL
jgi:hypothetical protein